MADYVVSTKQLVEYVEKSDKKDFIIGTEMGVIYEMKKRCPDKNFIPLSKTLICGQMKMTKLVDLYNCLKDETNEITLSDDIITKARVCLDRMLELS
jgi:quinolinate synthase